VNVVDRIGKAWQLFGYALATVVVFASTEGWLTGPARIAAIVVASLYLLARVAYSLGGRRRLLAALTARAAKHSHA
jgi:hypothetical protein